MAAELRVPVLRLVVIGRFDQAVAAYVFFFTVGAGNMVLDFPQFTGKKDIRPSEDKRIDPEKEKAPDDIRDDRRNGRTEGFSQQVYACGENRRRQLPPEEIKKIPLEKTHIVSFDLLSEHRPAVTTDKKTADCRFLHGRSLRCYRMSTRPDGHSPLPQRVFRYMPYESVHYSPFSFQVHLFTMSELFFRFLHGRVGRMGVRRSVFPFAGYGFDAQGFVFRCFGNYAAPFGRRFLRAVPLLPRSFPV